MKQTSRLGDALYSFSKTRRFKLLVFSAIIFLLLWFIVSLRDIFVPVLIGGLIAYILEPMVKLVRRLGISRLGAIMVIYVTMLFLTTLIMVATFYGLTTQIEQLSNAFEEDKYAEHVITDDNGKVIKKERIKDGKGNYILIKDHNYNGKYDQGYRIAIKKTIMRGVDWYNGYAPSSMELQEEDVQEILMETFTGGEESIPNGEAKNGAKKNDVTMVKYFSRKLKDSTGGIFYFAMTLVMIPIYAFLLQRLVPQMGEKVPGLIPVVFRARTLSIMSKINLELSAFFRGKLLVCFVKGFITWIGLELIGVNYSFFIGFLAGALSIIPYLGAVVGFLLAFLLTVLDEGSDNLLAITILFIVMEVVEFGLHIMVFGKEVGIHPLAFILALFIGGSLFGVFGVIMAVPLVSICSILWKEFMVPLIADLSIPGKAIEDADDKSGT